MQDYAAMTPEQQAAYMQHWEAWNNYYSQHPNTQQGQTMDQQYYNQQQQQVRRHLNVADF